MSLAYPVREYIAQRRQIAQLEAEQAQVEADRQALADAGRAARDPAYIKRQARDRLHYCEPGEKCYVVMDAEPDKRTTADKQPAARPPWYQTLWESVEAADRARAAGGEPAGAVHVPRRLRRLRGRRMVDPPTWPRWSGSWAARRRGLRAVAHRCPCG